MNLFIFNTSYHVLLSTVFSNKEDIAICIGNISLGDATRKLLELYYSRWIHFPYDFYYYKKNISKLLFFRSDVHKLVNNVNKCKINNIYIFNDVDPVTQRIVSMVQYAGDITVLEEGIGLYRNTVKRHRKMFAYFGKLLFGSTFEDVDRIGESSYVNNILCYSPDYLSSKQKKKNISLLKRQNYLEIACRIGVKQIENRVWFIGQPLVEDGIIFEEDYINALNEINEIAIKHHRKLIIKPHPREDCKKYNNQVFEVVKENETPVELLIKNVTKVPVITFYSSAAITLAKLDNVEAYSLFHIYFKDVQLPNDVFEIAGVKNLTTINQLDEALR